MLVFRMFQTGPVPAVALRSLSKGAARDLSISSRGSLYFQRSANAIFLRKSPLQTQLRTSIFSRGKIVGDQGLKASSVSVGRSSSVTWSRIAFFVKVVRIPFLVVAIYGLGYRQGITDTVRNPLKLQQGTFEALLHEMGVEDFEEDVEIMSERGVSGFSTLQWIIGRAKVEAEDPRTLKVANIGREVIDSARRYVRKNLDEAIEKGKERLDGEYQKDEALARKLLEDPKVAFWAESLERLEGAKLEGIDNWQYVLVKSPIPNAFVSEMLPQRLFVTTGIFDKFVNNDDELAMILGHEISHLVQGHLSQSSLFESFIRGIEILVLMLDPTDGLLSLGVATFLASTRDALVAAKSRSHETEADALGCEIAAMSCFDTKRGAEVFRRMHQHDEDNDMVRNDFLATHPTSFERYQTLQKLTDEKNFQNYSYCTTLQKRIARVLKKKNYKKL
ncbi:peptidase M48 Ste24p family protein [Nitzschia inconspicua]|uniref:Peptidase M48 Ste24p family protein n=1 Tax=Nitzschia inconspicua TaxID=303405 RepID=A0A9K3Q7E1_9STRA|nr:peptidase M48 Ste24p family protein [Nitzschia inconspicua]